MADDFPRTTLPAYGFPQTNFTPHLNRLADASRVLTHAYTTSSICSPSRISFMTGRYASLASDWPNVVEFAFGERARMEHMETLHRMLKRSGYRTAFLGKLHLGGVTWREARLPGVSSEYEARHQRALGRAVKRQIGTDDVRELYTSNGAISRIGHHPESMTRAAVDFVRTHHTRHAHQPFFVHLNPTISHDPESFYGGLKAGEASPMFGGARGDDELRRSARQGLAEAFARFEATKALTGADGSVFCDVHPSPTSPWPSDFFTTPTKCKSDMRGMLAGTAWLDASLGPLLQMLTDDPALLNTLTLFTSDHGNARTGKATPYEGGARVPLIVHWPTQPPARNVRVRHIDWLPTIAALAGAPSYDSGIGGPLSPLLSGVSRAHALWPSLYDDGKLAALTLREAAAAAEHARRYPNATAAWPQPGSAAGSALGAWLSAGEITFQAANPVLLENGFSRAVIAGQWKLIRKLGGCIGYYPLAPPRGPMELRCQPPCDTRACNVRAGRAPSAEQLGNLAYFGAELHPHFGAPEQLYHLQTDPHEQENLVGDPANARVLDYLRRMIDVHVKRTTNTSSYAMLAREVVDPSEAALTPAERWFSDVRARRLEMMHGGGGEDEA